jgi:hypothetical protein
MARFISYVRVSTAQQGRSGLGIEAQRRGRYLGAIGGVSLAEYQEIESARSPIARRGSGAVQADRRKAH